MSALETFINTSPGSGITFFIEDIDGMPTSGSLTGMNISCESIPEENCEEVLKQIQLVHVILTASDEKYTLRITDRNRRGDYYFYRVTPVTVPQNLSSLSKLTFFEPSLEELFAQNDYNSTLNNVENNITYDYGKKTSTWTYPRYIGSTEPEKFENLRSFYSVNSFQGYSFSYNSVARTIFNEISNGTQRDEQTFYYLTDEKKVSLQDRLSYSTLRLPPLPDTLCNIGTSYIPINFNIPGDIYERVTIVYQEFDGTPIIATNDIPITLTLAREGVFGSGVFELETINLQINGNDSSSSVSYEFIYQDWDCSSVFFPINTRTIYRIESTIPVENAPGGGVFENISVIEGESETDVIQVNSSFLFKKDPITKNFTKAPLSKVYSKQSKRIYAVGLPRSSTSLITGVEFDFGDATNTGFFPSGSV